MDLVTVKIMDQENCTRMSFTENFWSALLGIPLPLCFVRSYAYLHPTHLSYAHQLDPIIAWHCSWNSGPYLRGPDRSLQINSPLSPTNRNACVEFSPCWKALWQLCCAIERERKTEPSSVAAGILPLSLETIHFLADWFVKCCHLQNTKFKAAKRTNPPQHKMVAREPPWYARVCVTEEARDSLLYFQGLLQNIFAVLHLLRFGRGRAVLARAMWREMVALPFWEMPPMPATHFTWVDVAIPPELCHEKVKRRVFFKVLFSSSSVLLCRSNARQQRMRSRGCVVIFPCSLAEQRTQHWH